MKQGLKGEKKANRWPEIATRWDSPDLVPNRATEPTFQNIPAPSLKIRLNTLVFK